MTTAHTPPENLEPTVTPVGQRIRARRQELGLSQADIAEGMLSPSYVSLVESGRRQPATGALAHIAERLGVDVEFLRDGVDASVRARARLALSRAQMMLRHDDPETAFANLTELMEDPGLNDEQRRQTRLGRALARERMGDLDGAIELLEELAHEAKQSAAAFPWLDVAIAAARCYRDVGDLDKAVQVGEQAMVDAGDLGLQGTDEYVRLGSTVLSAYYDRGDLSTATRLARDLIELADKIGTPHTRGAAYWNASAVAESRGDLAQALQLVDRAMAMFGESDDRRNLARLRAHYAELLVAGGSNDDAAHALEILDGAQEEIGRSGTAIDVAVFGVIRARALMRSGRLGDARSTVEMAIEGMGDPVKLRVANARLVLAQILREQGDVEGCIRESKSAAAALDEMGTSRPAAAAWGGLADLYRSLNRTDEAMNAYEKALSAVRLNTMPAGAAGVDVAGSDVTLAESVLSVS